MVSVIDNLKNFQTNLSIHGVDVRNKAVLSRSVTSLMFLEGCVLCWCKDLQHSALQYFESWR